MTCTVPRVLRTRMCDATARQWCCSSSKLTRICFVGTILWYLSVVPSKKGSAPLPYSKVQADFQSHEWAVAALITSTIPVLCDGPSDKHQRHIKPHTRVSLAEGKSPQCWWSCSFVLAFWGICDVQIPAELGESRT